MRASRVEWNPDPVALATEVRALQPAPGEVGEAVAAVIEEVERGGDEAVSRLEGRHGAAAPLTLRVPAAEIATAQREIDPAVAGALAVTIENVRRVAEAGTGADIPPVEMPQGHLIRLAEVPVGSAGAYVPGGRGAYPSTAVMCCVPARVAGVERVVVATPPAADGRPNPLVLAACALAGADDVYAMGGAQAIAALALGTESIAPVDVVAGPGNRHVQEAKRQLNGRVGIDSLAGPSELMVIADATADLRRLALDLCAQAEHSEDGLLVACATEDEVVEGLSRQVAELAAERASVADAPLALLAAPSTGAAAELANALAPEHLELACAGAAELARAITTSGCVFVGELGATAFGDYAAGSNHVLPTGGSGRFTGPLGTRAFQRQLATVEITEGAAAALAPAVATLANAEGFPVHGESAEARTTAAEGSES
jgi:histidinol dehydrogenase